MPAHATALALEPFAQCPALDGCHCVTNSLAKIFVHAGRPLSEEMLLGLGAGIGFVYWQMKFGVETSVFVGGRANLKNFSQDVGRRTGVRIVEMRTGSAKKAEQVLLQSLQKHEPMMLGGDMGFLPWFDFPAGYHFGGHTFVACGFDGNETVLASDMDAKAAGVKKGFYAPITLEQLRRARGSAFKPFPPKNLWFEFDFAGYRPPHPKELAEAIAQTADAQLHPPIKNLGVSGIRHTAAQLQKWPSLFSEFQLRMNLFNLYIFIEIGGTGGGAFRAMYARFLDEAAMIAKKPAWVEAAGVFRESAERFSLIGQSFRDAASSCCLEERIRSASAGFSEIAELEERAWQALLQTR